MRASRRRRRPGPQPSRSELEKVYAKRRLPSIQDRMDDLDRLIGMLERSARSLVAARSEYETKYGLWLAARARKKARIQAAISRAKQTFEEKRAQVNKSRPLLFRLL